MSENAVSETRTFVMELGLEQLQDLLILRAFSLARGPWVEVAVIRLALKRAYKDILLAHCKGQIQAAMDNILGVDSLSISLESMPKTWKDSLASLCSRLVAVFTQAETLVVEASWRSLVIAGLMDIVMRPPKEFYQGATAEAACAQCGALLPADQRQCGQCGYSRACECWQNI